MYRVQKVIYGMSDGTRRRGYQVLKNELPLFTVNCFLEAKGNKSENTGRQYAYKLCRYLQFINIQRQKDFKSANKGDIVKFMDSILFESKGTVYIEKSNVTYNTAAQYLTVIKEFYRFLEDELYMLSEVDMDKKKGSSTGSYLYGQMWSFDINSFLDSRIRRMKSSREYIKWCTDEEIEAILDNLNTMRDRAIFALSLEGLRIDEILSLRVIDFESSESTVEPYRSKGKETGNVASVVVVTDNCRKLVSDYMYTERDEVLMKLELKGYENCYPEELFINMRNDEYLGRVVSYRNTISIIKRAAERAGLNSDKIRTHSGRSTKTMDLLYYQSENPGEITDEQIRQIMRWSSSNSIQPYINTKDKRVAISTAKQIMKMKNKGNKIDE